MRIALLAAGVALLAQPGVLAGQSSEVKAKLTGFAQVQFNTTSVSEAETLEPDGEVPWSTFETRRVRLGAEVAIANWISGKLETDGALGRFRVTDAWMNFGLSDAAQLRVGQFKKPFGMLELTSSSQTLPIERGVSIRELAAAVEAGAEGDAARTPTRLGEAVLLGEHYQLLANLGFVGRDLGAMLHGERGRFTYGVGVFNGTLADRRDDNDDKSYAARVTYAPLGASPLVLGAGASRREMRFSGAIADQEFEGDLEGTVIGIDAEWGEFRRRGVHIQLEGVLGDNLQPDRELRGAQGIVAWFAPRAGRVDGIEPLLRVSYGDGDTSLEGNSGWLVTPGINLYFFGRNRLMVNWDVYLPSADWLDTQHAFRAQAQLHF